MFDIISRLFDPTGFPRRWECGEWSETLGWLHICSDVATFAAYYAVPLVVSFFVMQRKDIPYRGILPLLKRHVVGARTGVQLRTLFEARGISNASPELRERRQSSRDLLRVRLPAQ
jgi:hypothetical protein